MRRSTLPPVALILMLVAGPVLADGFIVVPRHPPDRPQVRTIPLAVKYHRVNVTIKDQVATTEIDQVFVNLNNYELEGTYIFPIPEGVSISAFSMFIDGKEMPGELLDSGKARKIYEDIVRSMRDPALLEYAGRDMFRASIYPIPARGEKRVKLKYQEVCRADSGLVHYRYPLNTEKFSSRPLEDVSVVIDISGNLPVKSITCPTHPVEVVRKGETAARVAFEARNVTPDRDLLLYYSISPDEFAMNFITHRPSADEDGYFMLLLSPSASSGKVIEKDVCFVADTSGSMAGKKIEQAKAALAFCLKSLNPGDRFNLVPFSTEARKFSDALMPADEANVKKALEFVGSIRAAGGTAIHEALTTALQMSPNTDRPYMIVFLTDGLPTIGETQEPVIVRDIGRLNKGNVRLFAFGVGDDVNTHLLDKLAGENRGTREYVSEAEDLELKVSSFYAKVSNPVLSDLALTFPDVGVHDLYPKALPDLFKGSQLVAVGRYSGSGARAVKLTGKTGDETQVMAHDVAFPEKEEANSFIPRLWAIRKIGYLLDEVRLRGENAELKEEIVRLAKLHGVVTPYTSFLVLEDDAQLRLAGGPAGRRFGEEELDGRGRSWGGRGGGGSGVGGGGAGTPPPPSAPSPGAFRPGGESGAGAPAEDSAEMDELSEGLRRVSGKASVGASREANELKGEANGGDSHGLVPEAGRDRLKALMKIVEGTAFYKVGEHWVQAELPKDPEVREIESFSEEYFKLLKENEKIGKYLALGQGVFVLDGKIIKID